MTGPVVEVMIIDTLPAHAINNIDQFKKIVTMRYFLAGGQLLHLDFERLIQVISFHGIKIQNYGKFVQVNNIPVGINLLL
jgi:hypothetical protein